MAYTFSQLEQLWTANGGSPQLAPTMAAIALAESGGNPTALNNNPNTGDYSVGLWQINYYGSLASSRTQEFGSPAQLAADPNAQARAAISLAGNGSGLGNWTTYSSGKYLAYLNGNAPGVPSSSVSPNAVLTGSSSAGMGSVGTIIRRELLIGGGIVLGAAMMALGVIQFVKGDVVVAGTQIVPGSAPVEVSWILIWGGAFLLFTLIRGYNPVCVMVSAIKGTSDANCKLTHPSALSGVISGLAGGLLGIGGTGGIGSVIPFLGSANLGPSSSTVVM